MWFKEIVREKFPFLALFLPFCATCCWRIQTSKFKKSGNVEELFKWSLKIIYPLVTLLQCTKEGGSTFSLHWLKGEEPHAHKAVLWLKSLHLCAFNGPLGIFNRIFSKETLYFRLINHTFAIYLQRKRTLLDLKNLLEIRCSAVTAIEFRTNSTLREQLEPFRKDWRRVHCLTSTIQLRLLGLWNSYIQSSPHFLFLLVTFLWARLLPKRSALFSTALLEFALFGEDTLIFH